MTHYLDIRLWPDPDFPAHFLMGALYNKLHRELVRIDSTRIGLSFPAHDEQRPSLGDHMRLHGSSSDLAALMSRPWLRGMSDHLRIGEIAEVPVDAAHRRVVRVQAKSNPERLRRRRMKRHGMDAETARAEIPDAARETLALPFVQLASQSTAQSRFPLFISHGELQTQPSPGSFNSYGLSREATVPWF